MEISGRRTSAARVGYTAAMTATHRYRAGVRWEGSTGAGYESYERNHQVHCEPAIALTVSADAAFEGDPDVLDPEQLLLAATASCQLLSFLAVAARARIDVVAYEDHAVAEMPEHPGPMSIERIVLRPAITVVEGPPLAKVERLVQVAHRECFIANTLRIDPEVIPAITFRAAT